MVRWELNLPESLEPENETPTVYARKAKQIANKSAMPKINWNKNRNINQCMGNTQKG